MAHAQTDTPNIWAAAAAGLVAGLAASFVMDRFQAGVAALSSSESDAEPATEKAADKVSQVVVGHDIPDDRKPLAGQVVHYAQELKQHLAPALRSIGGSVALGFG